MRMCGQTRSRHYQKLLFIFMAILTFPVASSSDKTAELANSISRSDDDPSRRSDPMLWSGLRDDSWVVPLMSLSVFNLTVILLFELFIIVKTYSTRPSRRHLFLGQMLLFGLFLSSILGFSFVTYPNLFSCTIIRLGVGVAYALVITTLLVKCIFLLSLNSGVYLPAAYLALLLFFAVAVQLVVGIQWILLVPPDLRDINVTMSPATRLRRQNVIGATSGPAPSANVSYLSGLPPECNTGYAELLLSLIYVMFLLFFAGVLSIKAWGIKENYRESTYISLTVALLTVIWLTWMVLGLVMGRGYLEPCVGFGLVGAATVTFLLMFLPKGRQLAALGQEGLYAEDRDDMLSNASPDPSAFAAPSFYRFSPATTFLPVLDTTQNGGGCKNANTVPLERKGHKHATKGRLTYVSYQTPQKITTDRLNGHIPSLVESRHHHHGHHYHHHHHYLSSLNVHNSMMY